MAQDDTTHYETVIILRQDLSNAQAQEFVDKTKKELLKAKADISREESWGLRNLSYPIRKNKKGHYFLINHSNSSKITQEMERVLRLNENLLRLLTIRTQEPINEPSSMTSQGQNENLDDTRKGGQPYGGPTAGNQRRATLRRATTRRATLRRATTRRATLRRATTRRATLRKRRAASTATIRRQI